MEMVTVKRWTADEVRSLPEDGRRYEIIDGQLIVNGVLVPGGDLAALQPGMTPSPSWSHQGILLQLAVLLRAYATEHAIGEVVIAPADVELDPPEYVQPDLFIVPLHENRPPRSWEEAGRLLLAVEVVAPTSARTDRGIKRDLYQRSGVPEYWIVDPDAQLVERWRPQDSRPEILHEHIDWSPGPQHPPLAINLHELFANT